LGAPAIEPVSRKALDGDVAAVRAHAAATERLLNDPDAAFELAVDEAKRQYLLKDRPA
jgi:hypothetical protein